MPEPGFLEHVHSAELAERAAALRARVEELLERRRTPGTVEKYERDFAAFEQWCAEGHASSLPAPPDVIVSYVAELAGINGRKPYAVSTIQRKLAAIGYAHTQAGHPNPCRDPIVAEVMKGTRNELGTAPAEKRGVTTGDLAAAVDAMDLTRMQSLRDRAVLLLDYAAALRRSELVALDVLDLVDEREGLLVKVRRSKRDQQAKGAKIPVVYGSRPETCPVRATRVWLSAAGITDGPAFRPVDKAGRVGDGRLSDRAVALIVKRHMAPLGHDVSDFSGHSLRRGMATEASRNGAPDRTIQKTTRHASAATLAPYIEDGQLWHDPASGYLGL